MSTGSWTTQPPDSQDSDSQDSDRPIFVFTIPAWLKDWFGRLDQARTISHQMDQVCAPLSLIFNCCTLLVFLQKEQRKQNVCMVMVALAVADILSMSLTWSTNIGRKTDFFLHHRLVFCDILYYVSYSARTCSSWFVLLFTFERFIAVRFPLKRAILLTRSRLRLALVLITLGCMLSQVYFIVLLSPVQVGNSRRRCTLKGDYTLEYYTKLKFVVREIVGFILPAVITAILNMWIIILLQRWSRQRAKLSNQGGSGEGQKQEDNTALTVMLVTVSTFSILTYGPYSCLQVYAGSNVGNTGTGSKLYLLLTLDHYFRAIANLNYTVNFFFYCLSGRQFRNEFIRVITCGRGRCNVYLYMIVMRRESRVLIFL